MIPDLGSEQKWSIVALGDGAVKRVFTCETVSVISWEVVSIEWLLQYPKKLK